MKFTLLFLVLAFTLVASRSLTRSKRQVYLLPDGVEFILHSPLTSNFRCENQGLYADIDNNCQIFHICDVQTRPDGVTEVRQYSFACGNETIFNQLTMTCATPQESVPCENAPQFYHLNNRIGDENALIHTEAELLEASRLIPSAQKK